MAAATSQLICSGIFGIIFFVTVLLCCSSQVSFIFATSNSDIGCDKYDITESGLETNASQYKTLSIRGVLNTSSSDLELKPSMILPSAESTPIPSNRTFTINLVDKHMKELAVFPFGLILSNVVDSHNKTNDDAYISAAVPFHPCTASIIFKMNDSVLAYQVVSPSAPDIKFVKIDTDFNEGSTHSMLFPRTANLSVHWDAEDPDGDPITYSLLYSSDGGITWETVIDYTTNKSITVPGNSLIGNTVNLSKFRLIATDGVNTAIKDSESFSIPALTLEH